MIWFYTITNKSCLPLQTAFICNCIGYTNEKIFNNCLTNEDIIGIMMYMHERKTIMSTGQKKRPTSCYCLKVRRATGDITKYYDRVLAPSGVTTSQYSLLLNISRAQQCSIKELADMAELDRSTLARNLQPLLKRALVVDVKPPGTRNCQLELTQKGRNTVKIALSLWEKAQKSVREQLGEDGIAALEKVTTALAEL